MERNVKNILALGAKIHISCVTPENRHKHDYDSLDENIARCFIEDSLSDGLIWKDWCYPSPDITKCYRIHHDMTFERWKAPGLAGMGISHWYGDESAFDVDYAAWKAGEDKYLLFSPIPKDPRLILNTEGYFKNYFSGSLSTPEGEAAYEEMIYDKKQHLEKLLRTVEGGKAWCAMMTISKSYDYDILRKMLEINDNDL